MSDKTVTKAFKQLSECNLISEKKQGATKPNLIYVGKIQNSNKIVNRKNYESGAVNSTIHESKNLRPIYINNNYNYKENISSRFFDENSEYATMDYTSFYANI